MDKDTVSFDLRRCRTRDLLPQQLAMNRQCNIVLALRYRLRRSLYKSSMLMTCSKFSLSDCRPVFVGREAGYFIGRWFYSSAPPPYLDSSRIHGAHPIGSKFTDILPSQWSKLGTAVNEILVVAVDKW